MIFFILFVIIPLIEIALFVEVGGEIGLIQTLLLCVLTAMIGAVLIRLQGVQTLLSARTSMTHGTMPMKELFDGICIAVAGALLMTPGFFTDSIGFALLLPRVRDWLRQKLAAHFKVEPVAGDSPYYRAPQDTDTIEAEYERLDDRDKP